MADSEWIDEQEYERLQGSVSTIEALIAFADPGTRVLFEGFLTNAKARMATLEQKIKEEKKANQDQRQAEIAQLAERESKLSQEEKETYRGFLAKDFFTKRDFGALEQFYAHTWDRLSDGGKDLMSERIWEGVRHGEYRFTELPEVVREKEAQRLYDKLAANSLGSSGVARISEQDRQDFVEAYRSGRHEDAYKILDRPGFEPDVALESSAPIRHQSALVGKESSSAHVVAYAKAAAGTGSSPPPLLRADPSSLADINIDSVDLSALQLADSQVSGVAAIPDASGPRVKSR